MAVSSASLVLDLLPALRKILDEYGSIQIWNEFVQNADDARAKELRFVVLNNKAAADDGGSCSGDKYEQHANFVGRGAGLAVFNDGIFEEKDWTNLRSTYSSAKMTDVLSTGKFGIGFRSCFHVTDTPIIISGKQILVLDPCELFGPVLTKGFQVEDTAKFDVEMAERTTHTISQDEMLAVARSKVIKAIYKRVSGVCGFQPGQYFDGTLFLLPFRRCHSRLSQDLDDDTIALCTPEALRDLFHQYAVENGDCERALLFVKHINSVTCEDAEQQILYEFKREFDSPDDHDKHCKPLKLFEELKKSSKQPQPEQQQQQQQQQQLSEDEQRVQQEISARKLVQEKLQDPEFPKLKETYGLTIRGSGLQLEMAFERRWLLACVVDNSCMRGIPISRREVLLPWAGAALCLDDDGMPNQSSGGRVSVFLPLADERTGLPVVINGTLKVDSSRRQLAMNDPWNEALAKGPIRTAYLALLQAFAQRDGATVAKLARVWPIVKDSEDSYPFWNKHFAGPFCESLADEEVLPVNGHAAALLAPKDVVFAPEQAVGNGHTMVRVQHITDALRQLGVCVDDQLPSQLLALMNLNRLTPQKAIHLICKQQQQQQQQQQRQQQQQQQQQQGCGELSAEAATTLLSFVLSEPDTLGPNDLQTLRGLRLLAMLSDEVVPLSTDSTFIVFEDVPLYSIPDAHPCRRSIVRPDAALVLSDFNQCAQRQSWQPLAHVPRDKKTIQFLANKVLAVLCQQGNHRAEQVPHLDAWLTLIQQHQLEGEFADVRCVPVNGGELVASTSTVFQYEGLDPQLQSLLQALHPKWQLGDPKAPASLCKTLTAPAFFASATNFNLEKALQCTDDNRQLADFVFQRFGAPSTWRNVSEQVLRLLPVFRTVGTNTPGFVCINDARVVKMHDFSLNILPPQCWPAGTVDHTNLEPEAIELLKLAGVSSMNKLAALQLVLQHLAQQEHVPAQNANHLVRVLAPLLFDPVYRTLLQTHAWLPVAVQGGADVVVLRQPKDVIEHPGQHPPAGLEFWRLEALFPADKFFRPEQFPSTLQHSASVLCQLGMKRVVPLQELLDATKIVEDPAQLWECQQQVLKYLDLFWDREYASTRAGHDQLLRDPAVRWPSQQSPDLWRSDEMCLLEHTSLLSFVRRPCSLPLKSKRLAEALGWSALDSDHSLLLRQLLAAAANASSATLATSSSAASIVSNPAAIADVPRLLQKLNLLAKGAGAGSWARLVSDNAWFPVQSQPSSPTRYLPSCKLLRPPNSSRQWDLFPPYHVLTPSEVRDVGLLAAAVGVHVMDPNHVVGHLNALAATHQQLTAAQVAGVVQLLQWTLEALRSFESPTADRTRSQLCVPTSDNMLMPVDAEMPLYFPDWGELEGKGRRVHEKVPKDLAVGLGIPQCSEQYRALHSQEIEGFDLEVNYCHLLQKTIADYGGHDSLFRELLQNADDACSSHVQFVLDQKRYPADAMRLLHENMAELQGPALVVINDGKFSEADLSHIKRYASGAKREQESSVGKFGVGFATVYGITDTPWLVARDQLLVFDPHKRYAGLEKSTGRRCALDVLKTKFEHQWAPVAHYVEELTSQRSNGTSQEPPPGAVFRLPLRTASQARRSDILKTSTEAWQVSDLMKTFAKTLGPTLLFLKHVRSITLEERGADGEITWQIKLERTLDGTFQQAVAEFFRQPREMHRACLAKVTRTSMNWPGMPPQVATEEYDLSFVGAPQTHVFQRHFTLNYAQVAIARGSLLANKAATMEDIIAARTNSHGATTLPEGSLHVTFVVLDGSKQVKLPKGVHVNAPFFVTQSSRRSIALETPHEVDADSVVLNHSLLTGAVVKAYCQSLSHFVESAPCKALLAQTVQPSSSFFRPKTIPLSPSQPTLTALLETLFPPLDEQSCPLTKEFAEELVRAALGKRLWHRHGHTVRQAGQQAEPQHHASGQLDAISTNVFVVPPLVDSSMVETARISLRESGMDVAEVPLMFIQHADTFNLRPWSVTHLLALYKRKASQHAFPCALKEHPCVSLRDEASILEVATACVAAARRRELSADDLQRVPLALLQGGQFCTQLGDSKCVVLGKARTLLTRLVDEKAWVSGGLRSQPVWICHRGIEELLLKAAEPPAKQPKTTSAAMPQLHLTLQRLSQLLVAMAGDEQSPLHKPLPVLISGTNRSCTINQRELDALNRLWELLSLMSSPSPAQQQPSPEDQLLNVVASWCIVPVLNVDAKEQQVMVIPARELRGAESCVWARSRFISQKLERDIDNHLDILHLLGFRQLHPGVTTFPSTVQDRVQRRCSDLPTSMLPHLTTNKSHLEHLADRQRQRLSQWLAENLSPDADELLVATSLPLFQRVSVARQDDTGPAAQPTTQQGTATERWSWEPLPRGGSVAVLASASGCGDWSCVLPSNSVALLSTPLLQRVMMMKQAFVDFHVLSSEKALLYLAMKSFQQRGKDDQQLILELLCKVLTGESPAQRVKLVEELGLCELAFMQADHPADPARLFRPSELHIPSLRRLGNHIRVPSKWWTERLLPQPAPMALSNGDALERLFVVELKLKETVSAQDWVESVVQAVEAGSYDRCNQSWVYLRDISEEQRRAMLSVKQEVAHLAFIPQRDLLAPPTSPHDAGRARTDEDRTLVSPQSIISDAHVGLVEGHAVQSKSLAFPVVKELWPEQFEEPSDKDVIAFVLSCVMRAKQKQQSESRPSCQGPFLCETLVALRHLSNRIKHAKHLGKGGRSRSVAGVKLEQAIRKAFMPPHEQAPGDAEHCSAIFWSDGRCDPIEHDAVASGRLRAAPVLALPPTWVFPSQTVIACRAMRFSSEQLQAWNAFCHWTECAVRIVHCDSNLPPCEHLLRTLGFRFVPDDLSEHAASQSRSCQLAFGRDVIQTLLQSLRDAASRMEGETLLVPLHAEDSRERHNEEAAVAENAAETAGAERQPRRSRQMRLHAYFAAVKLLEQLGGVPEAQPERPDLPDHAGVLARPEELVVLSNNGLRKMVIKDRDADPALHFVRFAFLPCDDPINAVAWAQPQQLARVMGALCGEAVLSLSVENGMSGDEDEQEDADIGKMVEAQLHSLILQRAICVMYPNRAAEARQLLNELRFRTVRNARQFYVFQPSREDQAVQVTRSRPAVGFVQEQKTFFMSPGKETVLVSELAQGLDCLFGEQGSGSGPALQLFQLLMALIFEPDVAVHPLKFFDEAQRQDLEPRHLVGEPLDEWQCQHLQALDPLTPPGLGTFVATDVHDGRNGAWCCAKVVAVPETSAQAQSVATGDPSSSADCSCLATDNPESACSTEVDATDCSDVFPECAHEPEAAEADLDAGWLMLLLQRDAEPQRVCESHIRCFRVGIDEEDNGTEWRQKILARFVRETEQLQEDIASDPDAQARVAGRLCDLVTQDALECAICVELLFEPVGVECGHIFCLPCLRQLRDSVAPNNCPLCRRPLNLAVLPAPLVVLADLIRQLYEEEYKARQAEMQAPNGGVGDVGALEHQPAAAAAQPWQHNFAEEVAQAVRHRRPNNHHRRRGRGAACLHCPIHC